VTVSLLVYMATWMLRVFFSVANALGEGSRSFVLVHLPAPLAPWLGLFYGAVPVIIAALTLNLVNERLSGRLNDIARTDDLTGSPSRRALRERAPELVALNLRNDSVVTRYGGAEFAVLLPVASLEEARAVAERLRKAFESDVVEFEGAAIAVTISVGLAMMATDETLDDALKRADAALYRAKNGGRNRGDVALAAA